METSVAQLFADAIKEKGEVWGEKLVRLFKQINCDMSIK